MKTSAVSQDHMLQSGALAMQANPVEAESLNNAHTTEAAPWFDEASEGTAAADWSGVADDELLAPDDLGVSGEENIPELSSDEMLAGDLMSMYVRDVAAHPLLSVEEEKRLTQELLRHRLSLVVLLGGHPLSLAALMAFVSSDSCVVHWNPEWRDWALLHAEVDQALIGLFRNHAKTFPRMMPRERQAEMQGLHQDLEQAGAARDSLQARLNYRALMRHVEGVQFP